MPEKNVELKWIKKGIIYSSIVFFVFSIIRFFLNKSNLIWDIPIIIVFIIFYVANIKKEKSTLTKICLLIYVVISILASIILIDGSGNNLDFITVVSYPINLMIFSLVYYIEKKAYIKEIK